MDSYFENELMERMNELSSTNDILCTGLLTLAAYSSSSRAAMLTQHLVQALVPDNPEVPAVSTGHEHMFGEYSSCFTRTDHDVKIVDKIVKFDGYVYTLVVYDKKKDKYDIIQRDEVKGFAESYGFKYNNECIDSYNVNDTIKAKTMLSKPPTIDEYGNYMYGVNANVAYVISEETIEDAVLIRKKFAEKLSSTKVIDVTIPFNDNDIPLNMMGNHDKYKIFPDIGEKVKDSILCATRRKNKSIDQYVLKNSNLRKIMPNDDVYQVLGNYRIVDIDIWSNKPYDEIQKIPAYKQLREYYQIISKYWENVYDILGNIINSGSKYSKKLSRLYDKARDFLDPNCRYVDNDKMFSNLVVDFKLAKSDPLKVGCKICGRFGNKSIISKIVDDDEMGITENGIIPDVRMDALGVVGRLNTGQCIEQEINWMAETIRRRIIEEKSTKKQYELLASFIKLVNKKQYKKMQAKVDNMSKSELKEFINEIINDRIYIMQSPLECINGDTLKRMYDIIKPEKYTIYYTDNYGNKYASRNKIIIGEEYILRLKQEPITKTAARSESTINPRSGLLMKSMKVKKHKAIYPDQCNRLGEQELPILMISNDPDALDYYYRSHATSIEGRRNDTLFTNDPMDGFIIRMKSSKSNANIMFNTYLKSTMWNSLEKEYDGTDEFYTNEDIQDIGGLNDFEIENFVYDALF